MSYIHTHNVVQPLTVRVSCCRSFDQMAREADVRAALESKLSAGRPSPKVVIA